VNLAFLAFAKNLVADAESQGTGREAYAKL